MAILYTEVMNMENRDKTFLQKVKDNAFYLALGLGLFAILAVVGVYTAQQNDAKLADNEMDLNVASNYTELSEAEEENNLVAETNGDVAKGAEENVDTEDTDNDEPEYGVVDNEDTLEKEIAAEENEEAVTSEADENADENGTEDGEAIPTTVDAGSLDFNSEKTITWPVNGKVILPYSMETTVHFKTLDQYKCNPGMLIQAGMGTTVQNAYLGQVTNVTSNDTYGNMVTLYIGNDYSITYGQIDTIYVKEGDFVKAGQSIGTVGKPTDSFAEEGSHLFFQMSCGDETVDPMLYIE